MGQQQSTPSEDGQQQETQVNERLKDEKLNNDFQPSLTGNTQQVVTNVQTRYDQQKNKRQCVEQ
jgi:hypothetical protein